jgi:hypothetical protein
MESVNIDMVIHHIEMVILDIDLGYGISMCKMTLSILASWDLSAL